MNKELARFGEHETKADSSAGSSIHNLCAALVDGAWWPVSRETLPMDVGLSTAVSTGSAALRRRVSRETGGAVDNSCG